MISAYIHIPFCKEICSYCDFPKVYYKEEIVDNYLLALEKEIKARYKFEKIKTLYIGGGTPSALNIKQLKKLFEIISYLDLSSLEEFSIELNIEDINEDKLKLFKENKINRLSIGLQTINEKFYKLSNRYNDKEDVINKINLAKKYFDNISLDFIYAFPDQKIKDLDLDLDFIKSLNLNHISIYSLIIEPNTVLAIEKTKALDQDLENEMYYHIVKSLKTMNYKHYEISNFAKDNYQSKHNKVYWNNDKYYGFGLGASSYIENKRFTNTKSISNYLKDKYNVIEENIDLKTDMEYFLILGLRKIKGINIKDFFNRYNKNLEEVFNIDKYIKEKLLIKKDGYISIASDKLYVSNYILSDLIGE